MISIIICCYNSQATIVRVLDHIGRQTILARQSIEVIVVNNNSSDYTVDYANTWFLQHSALPIIGKIVHEVKSGLSFARARGVQVCKGEYIIFCDDDNFLFPNYCELVLDTFAQHPTVGILGAKTLACFEPHAHVPDWFIRHQSAYAIGSQASQSGIVNSRYFVWGAGMALRATVFPTIFKDFDSFMTDRTAKSLSSGGDAEICARALLSGFDLWYEDGLCLHHFVNKSKLTEDYLTKLQAGLDSSRVIFSNYKWMIQWKAADTSGKFGLLVTQVAKVIACTPNFLQASIKLSLGLNLPLISDDMGKKMVAYFRTVR